MPRIPLVGDRDAGVLGRLAYAFARRRFGEVARDRVEALADHRLGDVRRDTAPQVRPRGRFAGNR